MTFDQWCLTARIEDENDFPVITHLLYRVCQNDQERFEYGLKLLQRAYEDGQKDITSKIEQWLEQRAKDKAPDQGSG